MRMSLVGGGAALTTLVAFSTLFAQVEPARELDHFLKQYIGFVDEEIQDLDQGKVVVKLLPTGVDREIAVFGGVWIEAPPRLYMERCKDIENLEKGGGFLYTKMIRDPPRLEDFARLEFTEEDIEDLRHCQVDDCEVKLGTQGLERVRKEIDWSAPDFRQNLNALLQEMAFNYVQAYQRGGNQELAVYRDKERPTFVAEEFRSMLEKSEFLPVYLPELHEYLLDYPQARLAGATDVFYWQSVDFGLKPLLRINHLTLYRPPLDVESYAIASKQLYANHYFHTALELRFLVRDRRRPTASGFYFLNLNRSRSDGLTGFTGTLLGGRIRSETRDGMETAMVALKKVLEEDYRRRQ